MLRISYVQTETERRWTLCGHLAGPWVPELHDFWEQTRSGTGGLDAVVDLSDVTFIDESGERLLSEMRSNGVMFFAAGVDTMHLLENLKGNDKGNDERPLRRLITPSACGCKPWSPVKRVEEKK
jgi:hypothetical protein